MDESAEVRPYRKRKRAEREEETRLRIVEALVELHETVGPAKTTVTEVADRAGVSRMTVYNHFPTEGEMIASCSAHWSSLNPNPDPAPWAAIGDPVERLERAVPELYRWYRRSERMLGNVLRDESLVGPVGRVLDAGWWPYLDEVVGVLSEGWRIRGGAAKDLEAAVRVIVDFSTWRLLTGRGVEDEGAAEIAIRMVVGASAAGQGIGAPGADHPPRPVRR